MTRRRHFRGRRVPSSPAEGFTLLEIMVVIGIMAMLAGVLALGASRVLVERPESPNQTFWEAIGRAREYALIHNTEVWLTFDNEEAAFVATTWQGTERFPVTSSEKFQLDFLGMAGGAQSILVGGVLLESNPLPRVTFYPDGTCTPFRAQVTVEGGEPFVFEIDPWTCAPALVSAEDRR